MGPCIDWRPLRPYLGASNRNIGAAITRHCTLYWTWRKGKNSGGWNGYCCGPAFDVMACRSQWNLKYKKPDIYLYIYLFKRKIGEGSQYAIYTLLITDDQALIAQEYEDMEFKNRTLLEKKHVWKNYKKKLFILIEEQKPKIILKDQKACIRGCWRNWVSGGKNR